MSLALRYHRGMLRALALTLSILVLSTPVLPAAGRPQTQSSPKKAGEKSAPPASQPPGTYLVGALKVLGNSNYSAAQVLGVAGLKIGDVVTVRDFDNAKGRLMATGAFESVGFSIEPDNVRRNYVATFRVAEVNPVLPVRFEHLPAADADLLRVLREHDPLFNPAKTPAVRPVIDRYAGWLQEFLAARTDTEGGAKPTGVTGEVMQLVPGELIVLFRPAGARPVVARVFFTGNKLIPENTLQEAIWSAGVGMPWIETNFRVALDTAIRPLYESRGRMRVSFPHLQVEPVKDVYGVKVTVTVDEGEVYSMGKVTIAGNPPMDPDDLVSMGEFKSGSSVDFDKVGEGVERIRTALRHAGYLNAATTSDRTIDDTKKTVDLTITIYAGQLYKMGKLEIKGLGLDAEAEIKRIWTLKEGSAFNPDYPDYFLKRVRDDGMFDNLGETKAATYKDEKSHIVDVTLTFGGQDPSQKITGRGRGRGGPDQR